MYKTWNIYLDKLFAKICENRSSTIFKLIDNIRGMNEGIHEEWFIQKKLVCIDIIGFYFKKILLIL